jgi:hypothetical protein
MIPLTFTRIENGDLNPISYNCPPPLEFSGHDDQFLGISCSYPCSVVITLVWNIGNDSQAMFVVYSVLSWISLVSVCITLGLYATQLRYWQWPNRLILFGGYGVFWLHLSAIGSVAYHYSDLQCADKWNFQYHSWCKFSSWALIYGSMQTACWWVVQAVVVTWKVGFQQKNKSLQRFEPFFHLFCWTFPFISAFMNSYIPDQTASGGSPSGLPYCASTNSSDWVWFGFFFGPEFLFLLIVVFCVVFSIGSALRSGLGTGRKSLRKLLLQFGPILAFSLLFANAIVATLAQSFWSTTEKSSIFDSILLFSSCLITTIDNLDVCNVEKTANRSLYWYNLISVSIVGIGYAVIFISIYFRVIYLERNIIDPDRIISKKSHSKEIK